MTIDAERGDSARFRVQLTVLAFHRVAEPQGGEIGLAPVRPERFRSYLRWIASAGFTPILPGQWLSWLRTGRPSLKRPILITFDDAYAELEQGALPALERARFPATVFVPTDAIGDANRWDRAHGFTDLPIMSSQAIASWSRRGISFGSHGASHTDLTTLAREVLTAELERSMRCLREITGAAPDVVAYPYGAFDAAVVATATRHFSLGFTMRPGRNTASDDRMRLRRVAVPPAATWLRFRLILAFGFDPVSHFRAVVRPRQRLRAIVARFGLFRPSKS